MLHDKELYEWLDSEDAARRLGELQKAVAKKHKSVLTALREQLDLPSTATTGDVEQIVSPYIQDAAWVDELISDYLEMAKQERFFVPPVPYLKHDVFSGLLLFNHPKVNIAISTSSIYDFARKKMDSSSARSLGFTGRVAMYNFIRSGNARLSFWSASQVSDLHDPSQGKCWKSSTRTLTDGEVFTLDGRTQTFNIERADSTLVILQAEITIDTTPLQVEYSAATHDYVGCSAVDSVSSRIQLLSTFIRTLGREDAVETLRAYLNHKDFFVRWYVMREILALDTVAVLPDLTTMADTDPNLEVRGVAARTLARIIQAQNDAKEPSHAQGN